MYTWLIFILLSPFKIIRLILSVLGFFNASPVGKASDKIAEELYKDTETSIQGKD